MIYKYSILTCLFGNGYDSLGEIKEKRDDVEYICVTDNKDLKSDTWKIVMADKIHLTFPFVNQWTYVRYHPYEFVSTNVCLYVDATIDIVKDFTEVLIKPFINSSYEYGVMMHPWRSSIKEETHKWIDERGYDIFTADKVFRYLNDNDYKINGLLQSTILLTKHTHMVDRINNKTWELCHNWSVDTEVDRNNQSDLTYVINTLYYNDERIMPMSSQVIHSDYMHWTSHGDRQYYGWDGNCSNILFDKYNEGKKI